MKLTILILSIQNRLDTLQRLLDQLNHQSLMKPVQILWLGDNKSMSVGEKRNKALSIADGEYVCFIDDDDTVTEDYVDTILEAIESKPDLVTFKVQKKENNKIEKIHRYSKLYNRIYLDPDRKHRNMPPDHLCVWRKDLVIDFPKKSLGEDHQWAKSMEGRYSTVKDIDRVLYNYNFDIDRSETRRRL